MQQSWPAARIADHIRSGLPLAGLFAFTLDHADAERAVLRLNECAHAHRPGGIVAGPVLFAAADVVAYALILADRGDPGAVTLDMAIHFLRPARGLPLLAEARAMRAGRRIYAAEIRIAAPDTPDQPVVRAMASWALSAPAA